MAPPLRASPRPASARPWAVEFVGGSAAEVSAAGLRLPLERLGGEGAERIFGRVRPAGASAGFQLADALDLRLGWSLEPAGADLAASAAALYRRLVAASAGWHLARIWNYVPDINALRGGLENYRAFSAGRALAFEEAFGREFAARLPAASAVGCGGSALACVFAATRAAPRHCENPEQVPAYRYPPEHGPRPPSFTRATLGRWGGRALAFISGTAAIKGHRSVGLGSLAAQLDCTLDNLRLISEAAGLGPDLLADAGAERHFKVYLRRERDRPAAAARLEGALLRPGDRAIFLRADLCRAELDVEIEATLLGGRLSAAPGPRAASDSPACRGP
jgi:chorismate lyase/3-hydroxybenzoate synthase